MTPGRWLLLWTIFLSYLFLGAILFYATERYHEEQTHIEDEMGELDLEDLLVKYYTWSNGRAYRHLMAILRTNCNVTIFRDDDDYLDDSLEVEEEFTWTFYNSFFFALTTLSTIGYGNLRPTSEVGRMLVILYSLIGIPLNGIVLTQLGELFASTFRRVHEKYKVGQEKFETRWVLVMDVMMYLIPGILVFIILPSGMFVYFEGWTITESIYFAYVTLSTIGYGDYVAGQTTRSKGWFEVYKVALALWIMFGLGYLVMILGFISQAMRCKRMAKLEEKLALNLKMTHSRIWNGVAKDVSNIRRVLNELYLMKFTPVYRDYDSLQKSRLHGRSQSLPNLSEWPTPIARIREEPAGSDIDDDEARIMFEKYRGKRRQAVAENVLQKEMARVHSEGDLRYVDRVATFGTVAPIDTGYLLARVVDILGTTRDISPSESEAEFSDYEDMIFSKPRKKTSRNEPSLYSAPGFILKDLLPCSDYPMWDDRKYQNNSKPGETGNGYSQQWTWPSRASNKKNISEINEHGSLRPNLVSGLRRMSTAAVNFLSFSAGALSSRRSLATSTTKLDASSSPTASEKPVKKRRTGVSAPCGQRYSMYDTNYQTMCQYVNQLTKNKLKENQFMEYLVSKENTSSPVLESTSVGELLRILSVLKDVKSGDTPLETSNTGNASNTRVPSSPLFSLFSPQTGDEDNEGIPTTTSRRSTGEKDSVGFSAIMSRRASCIPRRRSSTMTHNKSSATPSVTASSNRSTPVTKGRKLSRSPSLNYVPSRDGSFLHTTARRTFRRLRSEAPQTPTITVTPPPPTPGESSPRSVHIRRFSIRPTSTEAFIRSRKISVEKKDDNEHRLTAVVVEKSHKN